MRLGVRIALTPPICAFSSVVEQPAFNRQIEGSSPSRHTKYVACSQMVRAPGCGPEGRQFDPAHAPHGALALLVERQTEYLRVPGLIPGGPANYIWENA